jgi:uncharacterized membrane protein
MIELLHAHPILLLAFGIGIVAGLRSLTAPAAVAWAAHFGWLNLAETKLSWMASLGAVIVFTLLAALELVADKLPKTPNRIVPWSLLFRACTGGLSGAAIAFALHAPPMTGVVAGAVGSFVGAFAGFQVRFRLTREFHLPALPVALAEDAIAILAAVYVFSRTA